LPIALLILVWGQRTSVAGFARGRRRVSVALRGMLLVVLTLALSAPVARVPSSRAPTVLLVDVSASVSDAQLARARSFVDAAWDARDGAELHVVSFAGRAHVAPIDGGRPRLVRHDTEATDLAGAVLFARGLVPSGAPHLVLLSDGFETAGDGHDAIQQSVAAGASFELVRLPEVELVDARVTTVHVPEAMRRHEPARIGAVVEASRRGQAIVRLEENGILIEERADIKLEPGTQELDFELSPNLSGLVRYAVEVRLAGDQIAGNNRYVQLAQVGGPPRVLLVSGAPEDGRHLEEALTAQEFAIESASPTSLPSTVDELLGYDEVILAGIAPHELNPLRQSALAAYVRDTGGGLLYVSGARGLRRDPEGRENLLERLLPVELAAPSERQEPPVAMVLLIDRSSSMIGEKLKYAKQAAIAVVDQLSAHDQVGVVAFDANFEWTTPLSALDDKARVKASVGDLGAGGGTRFYPALEDAYFALGSADATVKHIILLTDGESTDPDIFPELLARARKNNVTVSTVAIGREADVRRLTEIARLGGGRFTMATSASEVPRIFVKETQTLQRDAAQRGDTQVRVVTAARELSGIDFRTAPPLRGYLQTKGKAMAEVLLETERQHPLLVRWRYGLGSVAAFTSDATTAWAAAWLASRWEGFGKLWAQLARGLQRPRTRHDLTLRVSPHGERRLGLAVEAIDHEGRFLDELDVRVRLIAGEQAPREIRLSQTGPGRYATDTEDPGGSLLVLPLGNRAGRRVDGDWVIVPRPYSAELRAIGQNKVLLDRLERLGRRLDRPEQVVAAQGRAVPRLVPLSMPLLLLAVVLFLVDLFVKRARWAARR
jgi:Ca-activated chloride channel homolog